MASSTSPATSETVRLTSRAGAARAASRPPLIAETCLRTVFTSTIGAPDPSSSSWRRLFSACVTPSGGRLVSAELPPVKAAITRSPGPRPSTSSMTRRAAASERSEGSGWSARSTSTRSSAIESAPLRTATAPPSRRSPSMLLERSTRWRASLCPSRRRSRGRPDRARTPARRRRCRCRSARPPRPSPSGRRRRSRPASATRRASARTSAIPVAASSDEFEITRRSPPGRRHRGRRRSLRAPPRCGSAGCTSRFALLGPVRPS